MYNLKKIECWPFFKQDPFLAMFTYFRCDNSGPFQAPKRPYGETRKAWPITRILLDERWGENIHFYGMVFILLNYYAG